ncbi:MAG: phosphoglycolate phosphatase [Candidatus Aenigmarchaeota archaeon]|nr:phosphoglycolate phosphatase [Candidatus Aenigmarchaeota archaeon]
MKANGKIKVVATDVDGTLTDKSYRISLKAIRIIRELEDNRVKVILISSRDFPGIVELAEFIGTCKVVVAETGGVVGTWENKIISEKTYTREEVTRVMESLGFRPSHSNEYRHVDYAFHRTEMSKDVTEEEVIKALERAGIKNVEVFDSGFAVHVDPLGVNKGTGLMKALKMVGVKPEETLVVGDGKNDIPMIKLVKYSIAPSNANEEVKKAVTFVSDKFHGEVFEDVKKFVNLKIK